MKTRIYSSISPYTGVYLKVATWTEVKDKGNKKEKEFIEYYTVSVVFDSNLQPVFKPLPKQQLVLLGGPVKY